MTMPEYLFSAPHNFFALTRLHSVSSGHESSCEEPCKWPVITAVFREFRGGEEKGIKRRQDRKGRQSINSELSVKETDFLIHFCSTS